MKKIASKRALWVAVVMMFSMILAACGKNADDKKWVEEGAAKLGTDIRSGQFVLDGELYSFPMKISELKDKGWHVSNNYSNKDDFTLETGAESEEFEMFNDNKACIKVSAINVSDQTVGLDECVTKTLYMSLTEDYHVVFPGGIFSLSKPENIITAYGEPDSRDGEDSGTFKGQYNYTSADNWECQADLFGFDNNYTIEPFSAINYYFLETEANYDQYMLLEGANERCSHYVDNALKASFYGDYSEYILFYDSEENAKALYESEVDYFANMIMSYSDIAIDYMDNDTINKFKDIASEVLLKTKWEIVNMNIDDTTLTGTMEINLYPTNFFDIISDDIDQAIDEFKTKYAGVDFDSYVESQMTEVERDYATMVLNLISNRLSEAATSDPVTKTYNVDYNNSIINSDDWEEIDDIIMDMSK